MIPKYVSSSYLDGFIEYAFHEDVREGDHSTLASVPSNASNKAVLFMKQEGIIAGIHVAEQVFRYLDSSIHFKAFKKDGERALDGEKVLAVEGNARAILTAERIALNCLQRMSGIATKTSRIVENLKGTNTKLLDTRKTTPGFRALEKWAVLLGGGNNHRFGLFDMIMLKDNHIAFSGGIKSAIQNTKKYLEKTGKKLKIEIETTSIEEVKEVLETGNADIIMLDNMSVEEMKECVKLIDGKARTEASGGISEDQVKEIASTGVDFISMGAITHSAGIIDMSLKATK